MKLNILGILYCNVCIRGSTLVTTVLYLEECAELADVDFCTSAPETTYESVKLFILYYPCASSNLKKMLRIFFSTGNSKKITKNINSD